MGSFRFLKVTWNSADFRIFTDLLDKVRYQSYSPYSSLNSDNTFVTMFVPSDKSLEKVLTTKRKEDLSQDLPAIVKVGQTPEFLSMG